MDMTKRQKKHLKSFYMTKIQCLHTGDGVIDFQYLIIEDVDVTKNYSTVGIESPEKIMAFNMFSTM